jgi:hypothetical protein
VLREKERERLKMEEKKREGEKDKNIEMLEQMMREQQDFN